MIPAEKIAELRRRIAESIGRTVTIPIVDLSDLIALAERPSEGWRAIESAPKAADGDIWVLVWTRYHEIELRKSDGEWWRNPDNGGPTHWMPLPAPPEA